MNHLSILYIKDDEFVNRIREDGIVILGNEVLADHYYGLLRDVFKDLHCVKTDKVQYIYTDKGQDSVLREVLDARNKLLGELESVTQAIELLSPSKEALVIFQRRKEDGETINAG